MQNPCQNLPPDLPATHTESPPEFLARFALNAEFPPESPARFARHLHQNFPPDLPATHTESPPELLTRFARHAEFATRIPRQICPPCRIQQSALIVCPSMDPVFYQLCCSLIERECKERGKILEGFTLDHHEIVGRIAPYKKEAIPTLMCKK
jgi:hypothetical protein